MKRKTILLSVLILVIIAAGIFFWYDSSRGPSSGVSSSADTGYENATYVIDGASTTLINGYAETSTAPDSASKLVTQYFGNVATGDLTGNGTQDAAFIITQSGGGSGTFYYVVAALRTPDGYTGTNAVFLGDRIAPQTTEISNGEIIVNYADRKPDDPMTAQPSVGMTKYLRVENGILVEVNP